ncbi:hypothetical protein UPYG_G00010710 [Umbra pygmaea]|uniref:Synaptonemal complex protein 2 n=1 Tax=Umbra pygmaea TaxID=75934 RepID=A0ABD0XIJ2_UMBPY
MQTPRPDPQLEKLVNEVLKNSHFQELEDFLQENEGKSLKCSKQFLHKLDILVNRELDHGNIKHACLGLTILHKFGENMVLPGGQGISGMVLQGLVTKMVVWFEKARQCWIKAGIHGNETLINLAEDIFDSIMVVHGSSQPGTYQVTECFLHLIGQLATDPRIHIMIQKEAIRKLNIILDQIPVELKKEKKIFSSQESSDVMINLASRILVGGDYDLQVALMEALCRMTTRVQRKELADSWFNMEYIARAFCKIQDSAFETDCRIFLNLVNGMQGEKRRVFSYPCLEVFLDRHELLMPTDEKLEEFWIDFNLGSQSVSFYFSLADEEAEEGQWDTVCVPENEIQSYTVTEEAEQKVLKMELLEVLCVSGVEGSNITIHFSSSLDILQAARNVYGLQKYKEFVGKSRSSVVKTTVKIIMDESGSQTVTPAKGRVSESNTFITSSGRGRCKGASPFSIVKAASTLGGSKAKVKPALELVSLCERQGQPNLEPSLGTIRIGKPCYSTSPGCSLGHSGGGQHLPVDKAVDMLHTDPGGEQELQDSNVVPDSQPNIKTEKSRLSHCRKVSVSEMFQPVQRHFIKTCPDLESVNNEQKKLRSPAQRGSGSGPGSTVSHRQLHAELTQRLEKVLHERGQGTWPEEQGGGQGRGPEVRDEGQGKGPEERGGGQGKGPEERAGGQGKGPEEQGGGQGKGPEERAGGQGKGPDELGGGQGKGPKVRGGGQGKGAEERAGGQGKVPDELGGGQEKGPEQRVRGQRGRPEKRGATQERVSQKSIRTQGRPSGRPDERGEPKGEEGEQPRPQAGRVQAMGKPKNQMSKEAEATPGKAPFKNTEASGLQEGPPNTQMKTNVSNSNKNKREAEVTGTMMKLISSHYKSSTALTSKDPAECGPGLDPPPTNSRSTFNKSWFPSSMVGMAKGLGQMKTNSKKPSVKQQGEDVFAFTMDTPRSTGGTGKSFSDTSAIDSSANHNSWALPSTTKKGQAIKGAAPRRHVKKHLFSDTDTDAMTELSWLKESSRKPKPKVIDYSRHPRVKSPGPAFNTTYLLESSDSPASLSKPVKEKAKPKKRRRVKESSGEPKVDSRVLTAAPVLAETSRVSRRPQRAVATNAKSYKEPDSSSQSETEEPIALKKYTIGPAEKSKNVCPKVAGLIKMKIAGKSNIKLEGSSQSQTDSSKMHSIGPTERINTFCKEAGKLKKKIPASPSKLQLSVPKKIPASTSKLQLSEPKKTPVSTSKLQLSEPKKIPASTSKLQLSEPKKTPVSTSKLQLSEPKKIPASTSKLQLSEPKKTPVSTSKLQLSEPKKTPVSTSKLQLSEPKKIPVSTSKLQLSEPKKIPAFTSKLQLSEPKKSSWTSRLTPLLHSPPATERMRAPAERSLVTLSQSPFTPLGSLSTSPACVSSPPMELLPKHPGSSGGFQPSSFYSARGRKSWESNAPGDTPAPHTQRNSGLQLSPIHPALSLAQSPVVSPTSQLLLTSTALQKSPVPSPLFQSHPSPVGTHTFPLHFGVSDQLCQSASDKESLVSRVTLSQFSSRSVMSSTRVEASNMAALSAALEKTPSSEQGHKLEQRRYHTSGPRSGNKRPHPDPSPSHSDEERAGEGPRGWRQGAPALKMRPRKLFKPTVKTRDHVPEDLSSCDEDEDKENGKKKKGWDTKEGPPRASSETHHHIQSSKRACDTVIDVSPERDLSRVLSSHTVTSSSWEASVDLEPEGDLGAPPHDMGSMCRQFGSELQRKIQNRSRWMEVFSKHSMKTVQQHVSSISMQVHKYRSQKLMQVKDILLNEINKLEEDDDSLKEMEKELTIYWRKQSVAFRSYQDKETQRLQSLKSTVQNNLCHSLEYEERVFTSQMCLMKKDVKSFQDRLFKEMQDEEILSVKRGLQALFLPERPRF